MPSSPVRKGRGWDVPRILCGSISGASLLRSDDVDRFLKLASRGGCLGQHIGLSEARGLVLSWVVREGIGVTRRLSASGHFMPTGVKDTHSRTRASQEPIQHSLGKITGDRKGSYPRRSSGLRVQFVDVEVFSLLPQCQRNSCNLACQREAHHGGLDAFGERALVKLLERSGLHTGPGGSAFKQAFQIMVVAASGFCFAPLMMSQSMMASSPKSSG